MNKCYRNVTAINQKQEKTTTPSETDVNLTILWKKLRCAHSNWVTFNVLACFFICEMIEKYHVTACAVCIRSILNMIVCVCRRCCCCCCFENELQVESKRETEKKNKRSYVRAAAAK